MMKKILYGKSDFTYMIRANGYYVDKTHYIEELENLGTEYLTFLRPRRFGKSLFISMLEAYYDINTADQFDEIFGELYIGKNPTELRNSYPILKFDFSPIATQGTISDIESDFNFRVKSRIKSFFRRYKNKLGIENIMESLLDPNANASTMLGELVDYLADKHISFYLLIDEYDNFANNILSEHGEEIYHGLTHGTGFLRTFFTTIKAGTVSNTVARMFATGVSPLVMSDVTSGFNIDSNISQDKIFNEMVGFTQEETEAAVDYYIEHKVVPAADREMVLEVMKKHYDGYLFSSDAPNSIYNTNSVLYLLDQYYKAKKMPTQIIDSRMITDYHKLKFIITKGQDENNNLKILKSILLENKISAKLVKDFSAQDLIEYDKFVSFMYYLGLVTIVEPDIDKLTFKIPNEMCKTILWEYIRNAIESVYSINKTALEIPRSQMVREGLWEPFFRYVFEEFYKLASIRDFIFREEGVKCFLLAYLGLSDVYELYSETELNKGYADIYIKPKLSVYPTMCKNHYLIELKHLTQGELKPKPSQKLIDQTIKQAKAQLDQYANDSLIPKDVIKIVAITSNSELLHLSAEPSR
jgi:hypothetical protein